MDVDADAYRASIRAKLDEYVNNALQQPREKTLPFSIYRPPCEGDFSDNIYKRMLRLRGLGELKRQGIIDSEMIDSFLIEEMDSDTDADTEMNCDFDYDFVNYDDENSIADGSNTDTDEDMVCLNCDYNSTDDDNDEPVEIESKSPPSDSNTTDNRVGIVNSLKYAWLHAWYFASFIALKVWRSLMQFFRL